jgi:hypothetical protein
MSYLSLVIICSSSVQEVNFIDIFGFFAYFDKFLTPNIDTEMFTFSSLSSISFILFFIFLISSILFFLPIS